MGTKLAPWVEPAKSTNFWHPFLSYSTSKMKNIQKHLIDKTLFRIEFRELFVNQEETFVQRRRKFFIQREEKKTKKKPGKHQFHIHVSPFHLPNPRLVVLYMERYWEDDSIRSADGRVGRILRVGWDDEPADLDPQVCAFHAKIFSIYHLFLDATII
jgi:hypothetical protein